jgi:hypothetical protein
MLVKFRIPEILLGALLATAMWAGIFAWQSSEHSNAQQQSHTNQSTSPESEKHAVDQQIAKYTLWLALFTGVLAVSTIGLWIVSWRAGIKQAHDMRDSIAAANKMAEVADKQFLITGLQTDIQKKQHAVGRLEFLATHRPKLRVRHVSVVTADHTGHPTIFFNHGSGVKGGLAVVNVGGTKATIIESRYRIFFSKTGLPVSAPYDESFHELLLPEQVLDIGESCAIPIADTIVMDPSKVDELRAFENGGWKIYVMGQIRYQDEGGHDRFMGFCRERGSGGRFRAVDDLDYEYED